ncbi:MAG: isochorismatase family protein [Coleofasciculaceae cyanobacterium RL_1_1]|nr:isochorismatase family protein [Coleofasciculaceae cyanobacterium RL_1_1]
MTIPRIATYPMPTTANLPNNRVNWSLQPQRAALLIHDMQDYFLNFFDTQQPPIPDLLRNMTNLRSCCQSLGIPVLYTAQPAEQSLADRGLLNDMWGPGLGAQPHLEGISAVVAPEEGDHIFVKWRYSAFQRTDLKTYLAAAGRDQLMICGIYAHIGCLMTACEAFMNDIQPFFVMDAVADFSADDHQMAGTYIAQRCGITVSTQGIMNALILEPVTLPKTEALSPILSSSNIIISTLQNQLGKLLQQPPQTIGIDDNLLDWGLDSLRLMHVVEFLQRQGAEVSFADLAEAPTIAAWVQRLNRCQPDARPLVEEKVS